MLCTSHFQINSPLLMIDGRCGPTGGPSPADFWIGPPAGAVEAILLRLAGAVPVGNVPELTVAGNEARCGRSIDSARRNGDGRSAAAVSDQASAISNQVAEELKADG